MKDTYNEFISPSDNYTYGDGIITFYKNGIAIKDVLYSSNKELKTIIDEETKKEW